MASIAFLAVAVVFGAKASHDVMPLPAPHCDDAPVADAVATSIESAEAESPRAESSPASHPEVAVTPPAAVAPAPASPSPKAPSDVAPALVDFRKEVYPILERNCLMCHGPTLQMANFRIDRAEDLFGVSGGEQFIVPGDSKASSLIAIVTGKRAIRRPDAHRLKENEVKVLKTWIDQGAHWGQKTTDI